MTRHLHRELIRELTDIVKHRPPERHLVLHETEPFSGFGEVLYLDKNGVHTSYEAMGTWVAYSKSVPAPKVTNLSAQELDEHLQGIGADGRKEVQRNIESYRRSR